MRHFKNLKNEIFGVDENQDFLIQNDWVEITNEELKILTSSTHESRIVRIQELRALLSKTDYKVLPDYDKPNNDIKAQRQAWRDEIRQLGG